MVVVQKMKHLFKNQKGLTLIELLAVVVVLGIIAAIAVPSVIGTIEKSKKNADKSSWKIVQDAGLRWALENNKNDGDTETVANLVSAGYLNDIPAKQSNVLTTGFTYIKVNKSGNKYTIDVYDGGTGTPPTGGTLIQESTFNN